MNNMNFLLEHTDIMETDIVKNENDTIVRGCFYGDEDLSYTRYEYTFDNKGNFISCKTLESYY